METPQDRLGAFPLGLQFSSMILLLLIGSFLGAVLAMGAGAALGVDMAALLQTADEGTLEAQRGDIRFLLFLSNGSMFLLPGLLFSILLYRRQWLASVSATRMPAIAATLMGGMAMLLALPAVAYIYMVSKALPLPQWLADSGESSMRLVSAIMVMDSPWELLANLFIVALVPALGEEWVFRGFLQKRLEALLKRPHLAIWLAAAVFSAFHGQFQMFLPRLFLGAMLGYMFWWSGSLWLSVFAHFVNNAVQVLAFYSASAQLEGLDMDTPPEVAWWQGLISLALTLALLFLLKKNLPPQHAIQKDGRLGEDDNPNSISPLSKNQDL